MRANLYRIVETRDSIGGKLFDSVFLTLIVISVGSYSFETLPQLRRYDHIFSAMELVITILFTLEYSLRFFVAPKRSKYVLSFYGIIDILAILPFYLSFGMLDFRFLRVFRLFRLLRALKFMRYVKAGERLHLAFNQIRGELVIFLPTHSNYIIYCFCRHISFRK